MFLVILGYYEVLNTFAVFYSFLSVSLLRNGFFVFL